MIFVDSVSGWFLCEVYDVWVWQMVVFGELWVFYQCWNSEVFGVVQVFLVQ